MDGINVISLVAIEAVHTDLGMPALSSLLGETRGCLNMPLDALLALLDAPVGRIEFDLCSLSLATDHQQASCR